MHSPKIISIALLLALFAPKALLAQYAISTVAGGGPNNLNALKASIGYASGVALDASGNTYVADYYSSHVYRIDNAGNLTVVAGNGTHGYSGDGGPASSAALNGPAAIFVDNNGNLFIADQGNSAIREVLASTGNITTVAGTGTSGYNGDGIPATTAQLSSPFGVFVDASGNLFIADTDNSLIREVVASTGKIQTVAGEPNLGPGYSGNGGLATSAQLDEPEGVFVDAAGNIFIADTFNSVIREVTISNGNIQTVAGVQYTWNDVCTYSGDGAAAIAAYLCLPSGVYVDPSENVYLADTLNSVIREVTASNGNIATVAGDGTAGFLGDGGLATAAELNNPANIVLDTTGNIFIADTDNYAIREVTASNGDIQTNAGNGTLADSDTGPAVNAELNGPGGVFVDASGNVFIADSDNSVIREVVAGTGDIVTVAGNALLGPGYSGDGAAATNAQLDSPEGVFVDSAGNIFIADTNNSVIREVTAATDNITTVAGSVTLGPGYAGDGGPATSAQLNGPFGVFVDNAGNIFIADTSNSVIREVTASSGNIATVAGSTSQCTQPATSCGDGGPATSAQLNFPNAVFVDLSENIYIADTLDDRIREVTASNGTINTVAGSGTRGFAGDGAAATSAQLDTPFAVWVDLSGDIFIADTYNAAIREVVAVTGFIQTVAGTPPNSGFSGDGGQATSAALDTPLGISGDAFGDLYIADSNNARIRKLVPSIFVTVAPNPINVAVGAQQLFTASVTGTSNPAVTWEVNGVVGGSTTTGTISSAGVFTAPASVPAPATVTITAISAADGTTSGSAQATIVTSGGAITVVVSTNPPVTQVYTGALQTFIATVTGTSNTAVTWQVDGVTGGNATLGTIDTAGNYTGPASVPSPATVTIEAVSQALSSAIGTESITIVSAPTAAEPPPQTTTPGGSASYSMTLNENTGTPGMTLKLSCLQSTLPLGATCGFNPSTITPGTQAIPFSLTINVPAGSASLLSATGAHTEFYCALASFAPIAGLLLPAFRRRKGHRGNRRLWLCLAGLCLLLILFNACGSTNSNSTKTNPELGTYNVKVQGSTLAQPNPVTITVAGLTVTQ